MANASRLLDSPFTVPLEPFTNLFDFVVGNAMAFWLFPITMFTFVIYAKTERAVVASLFMFVSGALFSAGSIFVNAYDVAKMFIIFSAIGLASAFIAMYFQK